MYLTIKERIEHKEAGILYTFDIGIIKIIDYIADKLLLEYPDKVSIYTEPNEVIKPPVYVPVKTKVSIPIEEEPKKYKKILTFLRKLYGIWFD